MSYKIRNIPSINPTLGEVADFMEYQCFKTDDGVYSSLEAAEAMGMVPPEDLEEGDIDDRVYQLCVNALQEVDVRQRRNPSNYPFSASSAGISKSTIVSATKQIIYKFLLLTTREIMSGQLKYVGDKDGTALFEQLCVLVAGEFFGKNAKSYIFGTSGEEHSFSQKVTSFLNLLSEKGYHYKSPEDHPNTDKDGGIDICVFIPFLGDDRKGQFIALGQCKTGTSWKPSLGLTQPDSFSKLYIQPPFVFTPILLFMVSESIDKDFVSLCTKSRGILFDRSRIMQFLPSQIPEELVHNIQIWNDGVMARDDN